MGCAIAEMFVTSVTNSAALVLKMIVMSASNVLVMTKMRNATPKLRKLGRRLLFHMA